MRLVQGFLIFKGLWHKSDLMKYVGPGNLYFTGFYHFFSINYPLKPSKLMFIWGFCLNIIQRTTFKILSFYSNLRIINYQLSSLPNKVLWFIIYFLLPLRILTLGINI